MIVKMSYWLEKRTTFKGFLAWASKDFFPGEYDIFREGGGKKPTICLKNDKKTILHFPKCIKIYYFWPPCPPGPPSLDAHIFFA